MNDDEIINQVYRKIERERVLIKGANAMRQSSNPQVQASLDSQIREANKGIEYLEERLRELQMRRAEKLGGPSGGPRPPAHATMSPDQQRVRRGQNSNPPTPPPKEGVPGYMDQGDYMTAGQSSYGNNTHGAQATMPDRAPFGPPGPGAPIPRSRPNYTKLDLIKADTPFLGPRIQLMLFQLEFKLSVEKQYKDGLEKMAHLYGDEGDRKIKTDAEARRVESNQKIQLLKQALKRYEDLHVDMESTSDAPDDDSLNSPNLRKPLTGNLTVTIHGVRDVDHAATGRFARGPETFVVMQVEDNVLLRTKATRTNKWMDEVHHVDIDKGNEIELTVYDKSGAYPTPIAMLWVRVSDIAEEMRRKKIEADLGSSQWVTADKMESGTPGHSRQDSAYSASGQGTFAAMGQRNSRTFAGTQFGAAQSATDPSAIDAWFALEPVGSIHLTLSFVKQNKDRRPFELGRLDRQGAIRQRKEETYELYGHKFVLQQFYNIMRCAFCETFLTYTAGMQCEDCKFTCHKGCYTKVVTKCISKSNAETDPDEEKLNHRIPHRWGNFSNIGANWCCHCGYMLPLGRKNKKCSECSQSCHAQCIHFVPDFCGISMEKAADLVRAIKENKAGRNAAGKAAALTDKTLRSGPKRPIASSAQSYQQPPTRESPTTPQFGGPRLSHGPEGPLSGQMSQQGQYGRAQPDIDPRASANTRPAPPERTPTDLAIAAAKGAMGPRQSSTNNVSNATASLTDFSSLSGPSFDPSGPRTQVQQPQKSTYNPGDYAKFGNAGTGAPMAGAQTQGLPASQSDLDAGRQDPKALAIQKRPEAPSQQGTGRRIGLEHFNFLAVLGKGNFGKVMLAETKATKKLYAIKVLKKEFIIENDEVESTKSEKRVFLIANKERHPFLLNLHACFQTETRVYFVMEYISGGDLMLHIQRGQFGSKRAQFYAAEVCLALKYFHENGVIYRDLKLDNILLTLDGHIKIADYGLCKEKMWYGTTTSTFCGTPEFMAPEILLDKKYGRAVDWWAFGVLIYQMLLQQSPFRGEDEDEIYDAILADEPLYPIHMPRDSVSILQKLLMREPELRLGSGVTDAQEIMSHAFFRNINWDDVQDKKVPPPYKPQIKDATDTSNFDSEFTSVTPVLTPVQSVLTPAMQEEFRGFSYSADFS